MSNHTVRVDNERDARRASGNWPKPVFPGARREDPPVQRPEDPLAERDQLSVTAWSIAIVGVGIAALTAAFAFLL